MSYHCHQSDQLEQREGKDMDRQLEGCESSAERHPDKAGGQGHHQARPKERNSGMGMHLPQASTGRQTESASEAGH